MTSGVASSTGQRRTTALLAIVAACVLQVFRLEAQFVRWFVVVDSLLVLAVAAIVFVHFRRFAGVAAKMPGRAARLLTLLVLLPVLVQIVSRTALGIGDANEIVMLLCIQNAALGAAALSQGRRAGGIAVLLSGFLVLFVTAITQSILAYVLAALFGLAGMWWLMGAYWDRLQGRFAAESRRQVPVRSGVLAATVLVLLGGAALAGLTVRSATFVLPGFMPTSGGNGRADPYARAGVGDGDMLVASKDDAMSFGPVESELFLDSEMPSLYDVFNDLYGEPLKKKSQDKTVALSSSNVKEPEQKAAQSKQSTREFSTVRRLARRRREKPGDREATALLYVVGKTPLHLALETFDRFDGVTWTPVACDETVPKLELVKAGEKSWIHGPRSCGYPIFTENWRHAIKFINLKTARIPSPCHLTAWHIDKLDRPDFFEWTGDGILTMNGRDHVPQLTVIHLVSRQMNLEPLRSAADLTQVRSLENEQMSPYRAIPESFDQESIEAQAKTWTADVPEGWCQVEELVAHLRGNFEHAPEATVPEDCDDVVGYFLQAGRGPDYLFATAAAVMLRSLGYPARVVSGFYADPRKYDRGGGQTVVEDEDVHFWVEVRIDGRTWIPVEPTPGYEPPLTVLTWKQRLARAVWTAGRWVCGHILLSVALLSLLLGMIVHRREGFDAATYVVWRAAGIGSARRRVLWTVRLLEWRGWMAGRPRPANRTLCQWYAFTAESTDGEDAASLRRVLTLADWACYCPTEDDGIRWPCADAEIRRTCHLVSRSWTSRRLRRQFLKRTSTSNTGFVAVSTRAESILPNQPHIEEESFPCTMSR